MANDYAWLSQVQGLPWKKYASGPSAFDCHGLLCYVKALHCEQRLDRHLEVKSGDIEAMHKAIQAEMATGDFERLEAPKDGCIVLMSTGVKWGHVGMWLDVNGGRVLHSRQFRGVALDSLRALELLGFIKFEYWDFS